MYEPEVWLYDCNNVIKLDVKCDESYSLDGLDPAESCDQIWYRRVYIIRRVVLFAVPLQHENCNRK